MENAHGEEEWIEMPEGWGPTTSTQTDDDNDDDDEKMTIDLFANTDPRESFEFEVHIPQDQDGTKKNTDDFENDVVATRTATTATTTKTILISGFKLDSGESARSTGVTLWEAAPRLSKYIMNNSSELIRNKKVLELGAGLGLPGIVAFHLGANQVVLTDLDTHAMQKMRENVHSNCHKDDNGDDSKSDRQVSCQQLKWGSRLGKDHPFKIQHGTFDTILAADVIYVEDSIDPLFDTVSMLMKPNDGKFILCWTNRWNDVPEELVLEAAHSRNLIRIQSKPEKGIYAFEWKKENDD